MAGFNLPEELLYSEDIKKKKPLLDLMSSAEDEVRSPNGAPTPYTVMENQESRAPQNVIPEKQQADIFNNFLKAYEFDKQRRLVAEKEAGEILAGSRAKQEEGAGRLEDQANKIAGMKPQTDWSPLLSLTDTWTGSNFTKSYQPPETEMDLAKARLAVEKQLQDSRQGLTEADLQKLKLAGGSDNGMGEILGFLRAGGTQDRFEKSKEITGAENLSKRTEDMPALKYSLDQLRGLVPAEGEIPGVGVAKSMAPSFMLSNEGQNIRQHAFSAVSALIKMDSGKTATDAEVKRKMTELGMSWDSKPDSFRRGLRNLEAQIGKKAQQIEAGYTPGVVRTVKDRGGLGSSDFKINPTGKKEIAKPAPTVPSQSYALPDGRILKLQPDGTYQ